MQVTKGDTTERNGYWRDQLGCHRLLPFMGKMTGVQAMGCRLGESWLPLYTHITSVSETRTTERASGKPGSHSQFSMQAHVGEEGSLYRPTEAGLQPQGFAFPGTSNSGDWGPGVVTVQIQSVWNQLPMGSTLPIDMHRQCTRVTPSCSDTVQTRGSHWCYVCPIALWVHCAVCSNYIHICCLDVFCVPPVGSQA